jgi:uncharacterized membrane protein YccF (DUF307 family)
VRTEVEVRLLGNILWLLLGGLEMAIAYALFGLLAFVFIITIPFGVAAFRLAGFALWPFGQVLVEKPTAGAGSALANIVWMLIAGIWLAIGHLIAALFNAVTIIGIPFAVAHVRLAGAALTPFGHEVVPIRYAAGRRVDVGIRPLG